MAQLPGAGGSLTAVLVTLTKPWMPILLANCRSPYREGCVCVCVCVVVHS
jgi:hypothetical protein